MLFITDNITSIDNHLFLLAYSEYVIDVIDVIGTFAFSEFGVPLSQGYCK